MRKNGTIIQKKTMGLPIVFLSFYLVAGGGDRCTG